ncbi:MAG: SMP-30/gluconolactonase/LRE family protein [Planctomycetota bacterium]
MDRAGKSQSAKRAMERCGTGILPVKTQAGSLCHNFCHGLLGGAKRRGVERRHVSGHELRWVTHARAHDPRGSWARARHPTARLAGVLLAGLVAAGCDPPPLSDNGVVGVFGGQGLGPGEFSYPRGITAAPDGTIFVVDKSARIQRFSPEGKFEASWRTPEKQAGKPIGMIVHPDGRLFVADTHYHRVLIYDRDGNLLEQFGRPGRSDGEFELPTDMAIDADGFIYVSEYNGNDRITKWSPDLRFVKAIGEGPIEGLGLTRPAAIDIDDEQTLWVADACNHRIIRFDREGNVLFCFGVMGREPGEVRYPYDLTVTPQNTIMVCEYGNSRLQWFDKQGRSLAVWGLPGRRLGELSSPWGATLGRGGLIYVVDSLNSRVQIVRYRP